MIKLILNDGNKKYYEGEKEGKKILFCVYDFNNNHTLEKINEAFRSAQLENYISEHHSLEEITSEPLNLLQLNIYNFGSTFTVLNYNLYEYEKFINKIEAPEKALKSACICRDRDAGYFYIACEEHDNESRLTKKNISIIEKKVNELVPSIQGLLNMNYSHTEIY